MADFFSSNKCIKFGTYTYEDDGCQEKPAAPAPYYSSTVIKWYYTNLSYEDKYRLGLLTYPEYLAWMTELQAKEQASSSSTFWGNDEGERVNISDDDYQKFLAENNIDVSNNTAFDVSSLINMVDSATEEIAQEAPIAASDEPDMDEILKNVNKDMHQGDAILTQEEIAALFAAAGL